MKIYRAIAGPGILAASLFLTYPLVSFGAPPAGAEGDHATTCGPMQFRDQIREFRGPPPLGPMGPMPGFFPGAGPMWDAPPPFLAGLKLSDEQQDKVFDILYKAAPAMREQAKALRKAHDALREFNTAAEYDEARAKSLADTAAKADSQLTLLRIRSEHEIYALLTPEQRKEIADRHHDHEKGSGDHEKGTRDHEGRPPA